MSKLIVKRPEKRARYGVLDMGAIEDKRLSDASLGLLLYIVSRPIGWEISVESIATQRRAGKAAIKTSLKELQDCGYLTIERVKGSENTPVQTVWTAFEISRNDSSKTPVNRKRAGNQLDTKTEAIKGAQADNDKTVSTEAYQAENRLDTESLSNSYQADFQLDREIEIEETHQADFRLDTKARSNSYQAGNQLDTPYQAGNRPDGNPAKSQAEQGASYQADFRPVLKRNNSKKEHSSTPSKPGMLENSSPKKSPAQKPGYTPSSDARTLVNHLSDCLKRYGAKEGQFSKQWFFAGCRVSDELLKLESLEDLKEAIEYLVEDQYIGQSITSMQAVKKNLLRWQRANRAGSQESLAKPKSSTPKHADDPLSEEKYQANLKLFEGVL